VPATEFLNSVGKGRSTSDAWNPTSGRASTADESHERSTRGSVTSVGRARYRQRSEIAAT